MDIRDPRASGMQMAPLLLVPALVLGAESLSSASKPEATSSGVPGSKELTADSDLRPELLWASPGFWRKERPVAGPRPPSLRSGPPQGPCLPSPAQICPPAGKCLQVL